MMIESVHCAGIEGSSLGAHKPVFIKVLFPTSGKSLQYRSEEIVIVFIIHAYEQLQIGAGNAQDSFRFQHAIQFREKGRDLVGMDMLYQMFHVNAVERFSLKWKLPVGVQVDIGFWSEFVTVEPAGPDILPAAQVEFRNCIVLQIPADGERTRKNSQPVQFTAQDLHPH